MQECSSRVGCGGLGGEWNCKSYINLGCMFGDWMWWSSGRGEMCRNVDCCVLTPNAAPKGRQNSGLKRQDREAKFEGKSILGGSVER
jgi:hypothetical protein